MNTGFFEKLDYALTYLDATSLGAGAYAYRDNTAGRYYVVTARDLVTYVDALRRAHETIHNGRYTRWADGRASSFEGLIRAALAVFS